MLIWGKQYVSFPDVLEVTRYEFAGAHITNVQITIVLLALLLMLALLVLVYRTRLGRAMRATAQSPDLAALMGVNPNSVIAATFVIGAALAAIAGIMVSAYYGLAHYYMGFLLGLKAFSAAVLGGIGMSPARCWAECCSALSKASGRVHRPADRRIPRVALPGCVRLLCADSGAGVPAIRATRRTCRRACLTCPQPGAVAGNV